MKWPPFPAKWGKDTLRKIGASQNKLDDISAAEQGAISLSGVKSPEERARE